MALADTANLAVRLTLDDRAFSGPLSRVQRNLGGLNKGFGRMGKGVGQLGVGFARVGAIAAAAAAGGLAVVAREGIKWEQALAGVNKTMDLSETELGVIGTEIRKLAVQIPIGADAIAGLAEQAGALGIAKDDVVEFARVAATIGVTTTVSADEAASALGGMATILGLTGDEFERFASSLVELGNKGSSTEGQILELAERLAGAGSTVGLSAQDILGFSAALANVKLNAEAAGTAASTVLIDMAKFSNKGGQELGVLAKTAGMTGEEFKKAFREDAAGSFEAFIDGLSEMGRNKKLDVLETLGWDDRRVADMLLRLAAAEDKNNNLGNSLEYSASAWAANTAAAEEADKRYKTVGSKLELLRNQAIEGALLIGEGFLPALGRMADKLKGILSDPEQRKVFSDFGKDIGAIIDGIDFNKVIGGAKTFLGAVKTLWSVLRLIPIEITAAVAAFAGLNKLSGGLVGAGLENIFGGIAESVGRSIFTKIPGIGKFGALPVYVTNMGPGGLGGGVPGGGSAATSILKIGGALLIPAILEEVHRNLIMPRLQQESGENVTDVQRVIATGDPVQIRSALDGINASVASLGGLDKILYDLNAQGVKVHTESLIEALKAALSQPPPKNLQPPPKEISPKEQAAFDRLRDRIESNRIATVTVSQKEQAKLDALKIGQAAAKVAQIAAGHSDAAGIISAITRNRPIVSVVVNAATNYTTTVKTGQTRTRASSDPKSKYAPRD